MHRRKLPQIGWPWRCEQLHPGHQVSLFLSTQLLQPPTEEQDSCSGRTTEQRIPPATCHHCHRPAPQSYCRSAQSHPLDHRPERINAQTTHLSSYPIYHLTLHSSYVSMFLPELHVVPHPNFSKFHVPTSIYSCIRSHSLELTASQHSFLWISNNFPETP